MVTRPKYARDHRTGRIVPRIYEHHNDGYCIYVTQDGKRRRKGFGKGLGGLDEAVRVFTGQAVQSPADHFVAVLSDPPLLSSKVKLKKLSRSIFAECLAALRPEPPTISKTPKNCWK